MAFNNDISVTDVFDKLYGQVMGIKADGVNELEVCYCIGLGLGIILFLIMSAERRSRRTRRRSRLKCGNTKRMWIPHLLKMQAEEVTA